MKTASLRRLLSLSLAPALLCGALSGCGVGGSVYANYRELDQLRLIRALGYDSGGAGVALSASTGKQGEDGKPLLLCRGGESILQAMDSLQAYSTEGRLFFSHVRQIVVGREAAERGLGPLLDFAERDVRTRLDTELFVLSEGTAASLVMNPGGDSYDAAELLSSVRQDASLRAVSRVSTFRETALALSEYGAALVCLLQPVPTEGSVRLEEPGLTAVPIGYAILKDGYLCGVLESRMAEAASLLLNYPGAVVRELPCPGGTVTLRVTGEGAELKPNWQKDAPGPLEVTLRVRAAVAETEASPDGFPLPRPEALARALEEALAENLRDVLALSRSLNADFLALAKPLRAADPARFAALPPDWPQNLETRVRVEAVVDRGFDLRSPMDTAGGAGA